MRFQRFTAIVLMLCMLLGNSPAMYAYAVEQPPANFAISSITWQDPKNTVLIWPYTDQYTYRIYRSDTKDGNYQLIGTSASGSFRDASANYPKACFYQVRPVMPDGKEGVASAPMRVGTNSQHVSGVTVLMYHNFISEEDIKNGVEFEEYSISPAAFEDDLQYLKKHGYTTITSNDLIAYMHGKQPLPPKAVILSIDDGTLGVYTNAWPLLKKYNMKADFNIIGENIDTAWETTHAGGTRNGQAAPYCDWNEIIEMCKSGAINLCSHSYKMHRYNQEKRVGMMINDGESIESYTNAVKEDFKLTASSMTGWTDITPKTLAYPYSKRNETTDAVILSNTTYELLMASDYVRATLGNYFVDGASEEGYLPLVSRVPRMDQHPIAEYLDKVQEHDLANGINTLDDTWGLSPAVCGGIAANYSLYTDVPADAWYSASVYYAYVNSIMSGTSPANFSPQEPVTRGMAALLLYRLAGSPAVDGKNTFRDLPKGEWYTEAAVWAAENDILPGLEDGTFAPDTVISRQQTAVSLYQYAKYKGLDVSASRDFVGFHDATAVSGWAVEAMQWALAAGILSGNGDGMLAPQDSLTRAQMAAVLYNWSQRTAGKL